MTSLAADRERERETGCKRQRPSWVDRRKNSYLKLVISCFQMSRLCELPKMHKPYFSLKYRFVCLTDKFKRPSCFHPNVPLILPQTTVEILRDSNKKKHLAVFLDKFRHEAVWFLDEKSTKLQHDLHDPLEDHIRSWFVGVVYTLGRWPSN